MRDRVGGGLCNGEEKGTDSELKQTHWNNEHINRTHWELSWKLSPSEPFKYNEKLEILKLKNQSKISKKYHFSQLKVLTCLSVVLLKWLIHKVFYSSHEYFEERRYFLQYSHP